MPAKLIVVEGAEAGGELWIEYEVLRFGSDAELRTRAWPIPTSNRTRSRCATPTVVTRLQPRHVDRAARRRDAGSERERQCGGRANNAASGGRPGAEAGNLGRRRPGTTSDGSRTRAPVPRGRYRPRTMTPTTCRSAAAGRREEKPAKSNTGPIVAGVVFAASRPFSSCFRTISSAPARPPRAEKAPDVFRGGYRCCKTSRIALLTYGFN